MNDFDPYELIKYKYHPITGTEAMASWICPNCHRRNQCSDSDPCQYCGYDSDPDKCKECGEDLDEDGICVYCVMKPAADEIDDAVLKKVYDEAADEKIKESICTGCGKKIRDCRCQSVIKSGSGFFQDGNREICEGGLEHVWSKSIRQDYMGGEGVFCLRCNLDYVDMVMWS